MKNMKKIERFEDVPLLSRVPGRQLLVHSQINVHDPPALPPEVTSKSCAASVGKEVCFARSEESESKQG